MGVIVVTIFNIFNDESYLQQCFYVNNLLIFVPFIYLYAKSILKYACVNAIAPHNLN